MNYKKMNRTYVEADLDEVDVILCRGIISRGLSHRRSFRNLYKRSLS